MPSEQIVALDPTNPAAQRARSGTMRTPYNESGEHLEDDDETLSDPDATGIDLLDETMLDEEQNHRRDMQLDKPNNNTSRHGKQLSGRREEKQREMKAMWDSDDDSDEDLMNMILAKKRAKAQRQREQQQQQQQQQKQSHRARINHQSPSPDASHDTEVINNTTSTPPALNSGGYSFDETQQWERELRAVENLENNASPTPVPNQRRTTVDKIDTSFLESSQWQLPSQLPTQMTQSQSQWRRQSNSNTPNSNRSLLQKDKETWQEEAFRSSLEDLLKTVPYSYFTSKESAIRDHFWLGTCDVTNDESQDSITSQQVASAQLKRQRCFDTAARSLARLAIASRYIRPNNGKKKSEDSSTSNRDYMEQEESPDFSPPTPRTLPAFMSVLNVVDSAENSGFWESEANFMMKNSKDLFCGQSVHGRNARTVLLSSDIMDCNAQTSTRAKATNPFESWSLEQMAIGAMRVAAQVCHEAASDSNFDRTRPETENEVPSCRVAGFAAQNSAADDTLKQKHSVSVALVESALAFLATAFACLESDIVYAVLRSPLQSSNDESDVLVFDALTYFAPNATIDISKSSQHNQDTIPILALLTLSRGLEAAHFVARYATSLDPSSICASYTSPHSFGEEAYTYQQQSINFGLDEGGVGYLSAVGRDLGLSIESNEGRSRLSNCAEYAFDCILAFDPTIVDDSVDSLYNGSGRVFGNDRKTHRLDLKVDTQLGQDMASSYRRPSVVKDRIFSSAVEYLSSMVQIGMVSTWLSQTSTEGEQADARTVNKLCQKLFSVIEARARMRRSTNQSTKNECDNEAVCASALSLLIFLVPRHVVKPVQPISMSTSFRNIGDEPTANVSDLLQSSMVKKIVSLALSWEDGTKESSDCTKYYALNNAILILSTFLMAGAGTLLEEHASKELENFLQRVIESICALEEYDDVVDNPSHKASVLSLLFHLHTDCPSLVRHFLRDYISSNDNGHSGASFAGGLIRLCTTNSFAVACFASSLLRVLIEGNPLDRTEDILSELILSSFDSEYVFIAMDNAFCTIHQIAEISVENIERQPGPGLECVRWHPRLCLLSDMLDKCSSSLNFYRCIKVSLDDDDVDVTDLFAQFFAQETSEETTTTYTDTMTNSVNISFLTLFARFATKSIQFQNDEARISFSTLQQLVSDRLLGPNAIANIDTSMTQGSSIDLMHRALKLQNLISSLHSDERHLARSLTRLTSSVRRRDEETRTQLVRSEQELMQLSLRYKQIEVDRTNLTNALHDQRSSYERKLDLMKAEVQMRTRTSSNIHAQERKLADERSAQYKRDLVTEKESRISIERDNERITKMNEELKREMSRDKLRIKELEEALAEERKSKNLSESELEKRTNELSLATEELQQMSTTAQDTQLKLAATEESVSYLTAIREDSEAKLEDTCEKLHKLADIIQRKEADMMKKEKQFHSAYEKATKEADTAYKRYAKEARRNETLQKELEEVLKELEDVKANKAQQHRMRKNAPVSYLNSLHNQGSKDSRPKKSHGRRGKENTLDR